MTRKYQICLGHINPRTRECRWCIADEYNQYCPHYEPMSIYPVKIEHIPEKSQKVEVKYESNAINMGMRNS